MRRITDFIAIAIMLIGIASVYSFKEETNALSDQARTLRNEIAREKERIERLQSVWHRQIEPRRIAALSRAHLTFEVPKSAHYMRLDAINMRPKRDGDGSQDPIAALIGLDPGSRTVTTPEIREVDPVAGLLDTLGEAQ